MLKIKYILSVLVVIVFSLSIQAVPYVLPVRHMEIPPATDIITIDGIDDESSWSELQNVSIFDDSGWENDADLSAYFKVSWDINYFYLYVNVFDDINHSIPAPDSPENWMYDCIEFYLNMDTLDNGSTGYDDNTIQLRFNRGIEYAYISGRANPDDFMLYMGEKAGNDGWLLEVAIPWTSVMPSGSLPEDIEDYVANTMGFDVMVSDSDNTDGDAMVGNRDCQAAWDRDEPDDVADRTEDNAWNNTSVFGVIDLMLEPPPPAIPYNEPVRTMEIPARTDRIVLDGEDSESSWSELQNTNIFNNGGWTGISDFDASFRLSWDMEYLFFYADITDDIEHNFDEAYANPWMFDAIEFFIDLDTVMGTTEYDDNTIQLRFNRGMDDPQAFGRANVLDYKYFWENKADGNGWLVEAAIPWTCVLPSGAMPDDIEYYVANKMGLDINFSDSDNSDGDVSVGNRDTQSSWDADLPDNDLSEDLAWNNTHVFGIVELIGEPAPPQTDPLGLPFIAPVKELDIPTKSEAFIADNEPAENFWSYPQKLTVFNEADYNGAEDFKISYQTAWDNNYLYMYTVVYDDIDNSWTSGATGDPALYDNLELYFDLDTFALDSAYRSTTTMLRFARGNDEVETTGQAAQTDFEYVWQNTDNGWQFETAIPWTAILPAGSVVTDMLDYMPVFAFDIIATDRDNITPANRYELTLATWDLDDDQREDQVFNNTRAFGIANLSPYIVGLQENDLNNELKLYPNPAEEAIYIADDLKISGLSIYNMQGIMQLKLNHSPATSGVDLSELTPGIYLIKCIGIDGKVYTGTFVRQ